MLKFLNKGSEFSLIFKIPIVSLDSSRWKFKKTKTSCSFLITMWVLYISWLTWINRSQAGLVLVIVNGLAKPWWMYHITKEGSSGVLYFGHIISVLYSKVKKIHTCFNEGRGWVREIGSTPQTFWQTKGKRNSISKRKKKKTKKLKYLFVDQFKLVRNGNIVTSHGINTSFYVQNNCHSWKISEFSSSPSSLRLKLNQITMMHKLNFPCKEHELVMNWCFNFCFQQKNSYAPHWKDSATKTTFCHNSAFYTKPFTCILHSTSWKVHLLCCL